MRLCCIFYGYSHTKTLVEIYQFHVQQQPIEVRYLCYMWTCESIRNAVEWQSLQTFDKRKSCCCFFFISRQFGWILLDVRGLSRCCSSVICVLMWEEYLSIASVTNTHTHTHRKTHLNLKLYYMYVKKRSQHLSCLRVLQLSEFPGSCQVLACALFLLLLLLSMLSLLLFLGNFIGSPTKNKPKVKYW